MAVRAWIGFLTFVLFAFAPTPSAAAPSSGNELARQMEIGSAKMMEGADQMRRQAEWLAPSGSNQQISAK